MTIIPFWFVVGLISGIACFRMSGKQYLTLLDVCFIIIHGISGWISIIIFLYLYGDDIKIMNNPFKK
jgi:ABC-type sulfate transport system permease subunit